MQLLRVFALLAAGTPALAAQSTAVPNWMVGTWLSCQGERQVVETWIGGESGPLIGLNLTSASRSSYEFLRIAENGRGGVSYFAMPNGAAATEFQRTAQGENRVQFENPDHDFPQRIVYHREGPTLHARIEGMVGGRLQTAEWTFRWSAPGERCQP